jgi:hypothetical protein
MTEPTTRTRHKRPGADHERPCFCELCLGITALELLDQQAALLHAALADDLYSQGFERELADNLIGAIPSVRRDAALSLMVHDHLEPRVMAVDCLLDECDERSYAAAKAMADILLAVIHDQDNAPRALRVLVTNEICERQQIMRRRARGV